MRKRALTVCLVVLALINCVTSAMASDAVIQRRWSYIQQITNYLNIASSGKAVTKAEIAANPTVISEVKIISTLQQQVNGSWKDIKQWEISNDSATAVLSKEYYVAKGYSYRVVSEYKAYYQGSLKETASDTYYYDYK